MRDSRGQKEHFAFADRDLDRFSVFLDLDRYVTFKLVKKLFALVPVIVFSRIRAADDHYDKVIIIVNALVSDRRFEQMPVVIDPLLEIERPSNRHTH